MSVLAHAVWRKSVRSTGGGNNCVEVASATGIVGVRDSKAPDAGVLVLDAGVWVTLAGQIKAGRFDL
jgi:hypothetical protein